MASFANASLAKSISCEGVFSPTTRLDFVRARNRELNQDLKNSLNRKSIEATVRATLAEQTVLKTYTLSSSGQQLKILMAGFAKPAEVVLVSGEKSEVLFSSFQLKRNGSFAFFESVLSSDQKTLVMAFAENGSIDDFKLVVLDLASKEVFTEIPAAASSDIAWVSADEFVFSTISADFKYGVSRFHRLNKMITPEVNSWFMKGTADWSALWKDGAWSLVSNSGEVITLGVKQLSSVLAVTAQDVFLRVGGPKGLGQIVKISRSGFGPKDPIVLRDEDRLLTAASVKDNYLISQVRWGSHRWLELHDLNGKFLDQIHVPNCCSVTSVLWQSPGKKLIVNMASAVSKPKSFVYDVTTKSWDRLDIAEALMTVDGISYVSSIERIPSEDGTLVPMRITHRADLIKDGKHPTLFQQYGGFNQPGYLDPSFEPQLALFIKQGGIYATPALRGGNELGPEWHEQGMLENKKKTMQDLIACARWMTASHWTSPQLIVLTGTSNGGLTVASAALLAPESFGLVVPIAGVHDLLHKEELDPRFGPGWISEYGDSRESAPHTWLEELSPVELAKLNSRPNFLVITGRSDSRVNPEHSYRLTEMLLSGDQGFAGSAGSSGSEVRMLGLNNSGHWLMSGRHQNQQIVLRAQVILWTKIYDYLGWKYPSAP